MMTAVVIDYNPEEAEMLTGMLFTLATGVIWGGLGICFSHVVRKGINYPGFMLCYYLLLMLVSWSTFPKYSQLSGIPMSDIGWLMLFMLSSGTAGICGFRLMRKSMTSGPHSVIWAFGQSAVVMPCLFVIIVFDENLTFSAGCGMVILLLGMVMIAPGRKNILRSAGACAWFMPALAAFLMIGSSQILSLLPSYLLRQTAASSLRVPLFASAGLLWLIPVLRSPRPDWRKIIRPVLVYAGFGIGGQYLLYRALDEMSAVGRGALVYPLAIGISAVLCAGHRNQRGNARHCRLPPQRRLAGIR
jgi:uncharacterized membrane protein